MTLSAEQESKYTTIIDELLDECDLATVSTKQIRIRLGDRLGYDISGQKDVLNALIKERFDEFSTRLVHAQGKAEVEAAFPHNDVSNGEVKSSIEDHSPAKLNHAASPRSKRTADDSELSELEDEVKPKKKKVKQSSAIDDDAAFAARLQDEENRLARPTRGGATRKRAPNGKATSKKSKKKSAARIKDEDDSSKESGSDEPKEKKGAFHKPYNLSQPLAEVVGETQMSRPQVVKKIWEYVRARDLQDPRDKRQIRCDDALRAVFKSERVHMFTMNKILSQQLYAVDE